MQKLLNKTINIKEENINIKTIQPLKKSDIEKFYSGSDKNLTGIEYERLSLDKNTFHNADYSRMEKIILAFSDILKWEVIYDNETVIGAKSKDGSSVSLEPGMQFEISLKPYNDILNLDLELNKLVSLSDKIARQYDVIFLGYGVSPLLVADEVPILNKSRYKIMNGYLPKAYNAELCTKMMRLSAGIQINIDYKNNVDAYYKLRFFNLVMPYITALCSNSPFERGRLSEFKSYRAYIWQHTGNQRCNFFYKNIFNQRFNKEKNIFKNYINEILKVPMVYIERNGENIPVEGKVNFEQFLESGYLNYSACYNDYLLHQSLIFPDVRLKNYIEIRNHDSSSPQTALALAAFYKGLSRCDFEELIKEFKYLEINKVDEIYKDIVTKGLDIKVNNKLKGWDIVEKLFKISSKNLNFRENFYLEPIRNIIEKRKTTADILVDYDIKNAKELYEFFN